MRPTQDMNNFLGCRISSTDCLKAEALKMKFNVHANSGLMRVLIQEPVQEQAFRDIARQQSNLNGESKILEEAGSGSSEWI